MKALVLKELKSIFCSSVGAFFAISFLVIAGLILWLFGGGYNIPDSGYASLSPFFGLSAILLAVLIPALTMRQFSEERRSKTYDILKVRPIRFGSIYLSKFLASFIFILVTLLSTLIYVYSISCLANPVGNIDIMSIAASYFSLILLSAVFIVIGLFASSITQNQIVALILSIFICLFVFFGFELFAGLFLSGKVQAMLSSMGLMYHYQLMQRGVIQLKDLLVVLNYILIFFTLTLIFKGTNKKTISRHLLILVILNLSLFFIPNLRFDFTTDKRYTLDNYSQKLLSDLQDKDPVRVVLYLEGDLNAGFQRLRNATNELLVDFNQYTDNSIDISFQNPHHIYNSPNAMHKSMSERNMHGIMLNETDREGKVSQKMIYPYAQVMQGQDTLVVPLLKNIQGYTAEENLNASAESLEFEFIDAIRLLYQERAKSIAFIEGHGELPRNYVYDAEEILSKYYFVNRGQIGNDVSVLDGFDAIIIAGPTKKYAEQEKYVIDQYIMSGGRVLWLVDGAYYSHNDLAKEGRSASMKNEVGLDDLLFNYGVRINSNFIQDKQSASIYLIMDDSKNPTLMPCYFMPFLMPLADNAITRNIKEVKSAFVSSIDIVDNSADIDKKILLTSSAHSHLMRVPEMVDFDVIDIQHEDNYFDQSYIPVAVSLEGIFNSAFVNRMKPDSLLGDRPVSDKSKLSKMIVVASSDIIRNELRGQGRETQLVPMGYDRVSDRLFGNRDFIVNAVNWLTDDDGWMELRTKQQQMYILNKQAVFENRNFYAALNVVVPILSVLLIMGCITLYRKRKYEK